MPGTNRVRCLGAQQDAMDDVRLAAADVLGPLGEKPRGCLLINRAAADSLPFEPTAGPQVPRCLPWITSRPLR